MIAYYLRLALRSLRRTPVMTALMVCAIGLGIGASMTMLTVLHVMTQDPIPAKSGVLFYPTLDPLPADWPVGKWGNPADNLTWPDAMALMRQGKPARQALMAGGGLLVWPLNAAARPTEQGGRYTTWQFFDLFGVPLEHGSSWTAADDEHHARAVVLGHDLAMKLFGSTDVVGRSVRLKDTAFRVVGVAAHPTVGRGHHAHSMPSRGRLRERASGQDHFVVRVSVEGDDRGHAVEYPGLR